MMGDTPSGVLLGGFDRGVSASFRKSCPTLPRGGSFNSPALGRSSRFSPGLALKLHRGADRGVPVPQIVKEAEVIQLVRVVEQIMDIVEVLLTLCEQQFVACVKVDSACRGGLMKPWVWRLL